jgi:hypothetical protein
MLLLTQPGATFKGTAGRRYGALIRGVHPDRPEIVHNAFHGALGLSRRVTSAVLWVMSLVMLGSMNAVRFNHLRHHRNDAQHRLPDNDLLDDRR